MRWHRATSLNGIVVSEQINDLDSLPVPAVGSGDRAARRTYGIPQSFTRPVGGGFPCWPAAAALSSAPTARTGFSRAIAPDRLRTSWTSSNGCAISIPGRTSSSAIPCSREQRDRCLELCDEIQSRGLTLTIRGGNPARPSRRPSCLTGCTPPGSAR